MSKPGVLSLFGGYGIEMEYMVVDRETLCVLPVADEILRAVAGDYVAVTEQGALAWSNELVLHVIELKTNGPASTLEALPQAFAADVMRIDALLGAMGGRLMPSAMHPWMDPHRETRLWPHEDNVIYRAYDRIFGCQGHGWSNLQSTHINLPFADDQEFARLHAAIRFLLPIVPALAASSPVADARRTGFMDTRLAAYRGNARRIPSITGRVIPENAAGREDYERRILAPMYGDIAPYDPAGVLQHEWLNSRGAIARFDRHAIEIRLLDIQECPLADLAIAAAIVAVLQALVAERWCGLAEQQAHDTEALETLLLEIIRRGDLGSIHDLDYLGKLGFSGTYATAGELWQHLLESVRPSPLAPVALWRAPLALILEQGCLARRILEALKQGQPAFRARLADVYRALCDCLAASRLFRG
ncbi:MAG: glutamate-cysteine ligase family protein [Gammaproteobacteria bacterium]